MHVAKNANRSVSARALGIRIGVGVFDIRTLESSQTVPLDLCELRKLTGLYLCSFNLMLVANKLTAIKREKTDCNE